MLRIAARCSAESTPRDLRGWSQWQGPDRSAFFAVVFKAISEHAQIDVGLPSASPPFRMSDPSLAADVMQRSGFDGIEIEEVPVILPAPAATFFDFFRKFSVRTTMILECQEPGVLQMIENQILSGLRAYEEDGSLQVPMPAMVVSGLKTW